MALYDAGPSGLDDQVDTLYLDPIEALAQSKLAARVAMPGTTTGLQVCWHAGDKELPGAPSNCVRLPISEGINEAASFLARTHLRWPVAIRFPLTFPKGEKRDAYRTMMNGVLDDALIIHNTARDRDLERIHAGFRLRQKGENIRVMGVARRQTTVMQHVMQSWLAGFKNLGYETRLIIEPDDMSTVNKGIIAQSIADFMPHVFLIINRMDMLELPMPADMVFASWWQDLMPELTAGKPLAWRERDLVYLIMSGLGFKQSMLKTGIEPERIRLQNLIIDESIFNSVGTERRERKIVFVGLNALPENAEQAEVAHALEKRLENGERLSIDQVNIGTNEGDDVYVRMAVLHGAIRRHAVKMLCRQRKMPVEIWGRNWDNEPEVWPYFKGEVRYGADLVSLYRSATHALSVHPEIINHSRLGEIAGCGCIPIVYDIRHVAEPPFWEDRIKYFHNQETLNKALVHNNRVDCRPILQHLSNTHFAARVISDAGCWLEPKE